jgi:hypothetical protein
MGGKKKSKIKLFKGHVIEEFFSCYAYEVVKLIVLYIYTCHKIIRYIP